MFFPDMIFNDLLSSFGLTRVPDQVGRALYGHKASREMKTDVREFDDHYDLIIDLPGFKKEDIGISLENGFLKVCASKSVDKDKKDEDGKVISCERYSGVLERSFYVGDSFTESDFGAKLEHGVLTIGVPKKELLKPEKKTIMIEG